MKPIKTNAERFWGKVQKGDGCWLWTGALQRDGYAHFRSRERKTISAHRFSYELHVGPIQAGLDILHSCDVRHCVNPAHLRPGTHDENMLEASLKGRNVRGERSPYAKLNDEAVRKIRAEYWSRTIGRRTAASNAKELAERYGVAVGTICAVAAGRAWSHVQ